METSLHLYAQGANPNYFYKEKGTNPLHVSAKAGQPFQLELLIATGGNPSTFDSTGQTPGGNRKVMDFRKSLLAGSKFPSLVESQLFGNILDDMSPNIK